MVNFTEFIKLNEDHLRKNQAQRYVKIYKQTGDDSYVRKLINLRLKNIQEIQKAADRCRRTLNGLNLEYGDLPYLEIIENLECDLGLSTTNCEVINKLELYNDHLIEWGRKSK